MNFPALKCLVTKYYCRKDYYKEKDLFRFKSDLILNEEKRQCLCVMNGVVVFAMSVHLALKSGSANIVFMSILIEVFDGKADL